jgi:hypothetical protein
MKFLIFCFLLTGCFSKAKKSAQRNALPETRIFSNTSNSSSSGSSQLESGLTSDSFKMQETSGGLKVPQKIMEWWPEANRDFLTGVDRTSLLAKKPFVKPVTYYTKNFDQVKGWLGISTHLLYWVEADRRHMILDRTIESAHKKNVHPAWDVLTGKAFMRKTYKRKRLYRVLLEVMVPKYFATLEDWVKERVVPIIHVERVSDRKFQTWEPMVSGDLSDILKNPESFPNDMSVEGKVRLTKDFLTGLCNMNRQEYSFDADGTTYKVRFFHNDLKTDNVFRLEKDGVNILMMGDYDISHMGNRGGTSGWYPPEFVVSAVQDSEIWHDWAAYHKFTEGWIEKKDAWGAGLIVASILMGTVGNNGKRTRLPPLPSLLSKLKSGTSRKIARLRMYPEVAELTQAEMDEDFATLLKEAPEEHKLLWNYVRQLTLIDWKKRATTLEVCKELGV